MKNIYKAFKSSPRYSIKWSNYFDIYENLLEQFKNKKIKVLEIGVGDGGSLFMWKSILKRNSKIYGIDLNPAALKLKKYGFNITIGDQSKKNFWKRFFKKNKNFDLIIDDGGHTNLQQITTLMESINYVNDGGMIIVEDTHTSFMRNKGFRNPSKYSLINFSSNIIENIHRRNPNLNKDLSIFSKKVFSIEYFDSLVVFKINKKKCKKTKNLENNKKLRNLFPDYRYKRNINFKDNSDNLIQNYIEKNFSKRSIFYKILERILIKDYINKIK